MRGIGYNLQAIVDNNKGSSFEAKCKKEANLTGIHEPFFGLDTKRSPSPSTSTSTLSSSLGGGGGNASSGGGGSGPNNSASLVFISEETMNHKWQVSVPENEQESGGLKDEWATELQPISGAGNPQRFGLGNGMEDWESLFSDSASHDQLRWISGDVGETSLSLKQLLQGRNNNETEDTSCLQPWGNAVTDFNSSLGVSNSGAASTLAPNSRVLNYHPNPQNPNSPLPANHQFINQNMNNLDMSSVLLLANNNNSQKDQHQFEPQPKRHNLGIPNRNTGATKTPFVDGFLQSMKQPPMGFSNQFNLLPPHQLLQKPFITPKQELPGGNREQISAASHLHQQQQQVIYDQLYKATELILSGNFSHAQAILARLNHQLSLNIKPFQRAAFYFKEALQTSLLEISDPVSTISSRIPTPVDGMFKIGAYKVLSEVSPLIQFMNFTSNQALLEALGNADSIHIIDFDIGFGAQWSSFLQELPRTDISPPSLKITAFASPTTHHPIELGLMHENLTQFATDIGVSFELEVVNFDSFDPNSYSMSMDNEAVAVNFPVWSASNHLPALPSLLSFIKRLSPKIMVSMDRGCERIDLPCPQHLLHTLQYYEILFDSLDAANVTPDTVSKMERFLFQPNIKSMVTGRLHFPEQMHPWKSVFASMGFSPVSFSNFAETQAECLVKRTQVRGFHVEKHQASLVLCCKNRELMSVSAWRC
ncbi:scarecrow-like protein 22 [Heracleum sosnowskyi]|uniref:Scarecrow-like protein 22 n=1 Tax=Heracleum sosnowskyi TaxID=360622 RepID=A0AAD8MK67_9APIA|nr:scarecrow-like protein 22 [Heracleum sosnowskyi]